MPSRTARAAVVISMVALGLTGGATPAHSAGATCAGVAANGLVPLFESEPEPPGDTLVPGPGDDLVDVGINTVLRDDGWNSPDTIDYSSSDTVVVAQPEPTLGAVIELLGSSRSDHLLGTELSDQLIGNGGGDHIEGRGGDDLVMNAWDEYSPARGEDADDVFDGGPGADHLDSTGGTDTLLGGAGADHICKERGPTTIDAGPGRDEIEVYLSGGRHAITGGDGRDHLSLGVLDSFPRTRGMFDHRHELFRVRRAHGSRTRATIASVERVAMPSTARGRGGDDVLRGSYADDVLIGGGGDVRAVGGRGTDRCRAETTRGCEFAE